MCQTTMLLFLYLIAFPLYMVAVFGSIPVQTSYSNSTLPAVALTTSLPLPPVSPSITFYTPVCAIQAYLALCWTWERQNEGNDIVTIDDNTNTTSTNTKNARSSGVDGTSFSHTAQTNAAGTVTQEITGFYGLTTVVTYPTPFCDYQTEFTWEGKIPSTSNGLVTCITASPHASIILGPSHPPYIPSWDLTSYPYDDTSGKYGSGYTANWDYTNIDPTFVSTAFPTDRLAGLIIETCSELEIQVTRLGIERPFASDILETSTSYVAMSTTLESQVSVKATETSIGSTSSGEASQTLPKQETRSSDLKRNTVPQPGALSITSTAYAVSTEGLDEGETLTSGDVTTVSGTPISLPPSGTYIFEDSSSIPIPAKTTVPKAITFAGHTYTENSASAFLIEGQSLTVGGVVTLSGTLISLPTSAAYILEGTSTIPFVTATGNPEPAVLTLAGKTSTRNSESAFVIGGQTLQSGGVITVSGTPVSLPSTPTDIGSSTSTPGLASLIMNGFSGGPGPSPSTGANGTISSFKSAAVRGRECGWLGMAIAMGIGGFWVFMG